jgi:single-stranded-DNA-specific exonuclease
MEKNTATKVVDPGAGRPQPRIETRQVNGEVERQALDLGLHPVAARVLAARNISTGNLAITMNAGMADLDLPARLKGIDRAAARIADAIISKQVIAACFDFDCDGTSAAACCVLACTKYFGHESSRLHVVVSNRFTDGYGLTDTVVERILKLPDRPSLVITMDMGSTNERQIARLAAESIDCVVTDHHACPPEGAPKSAIATVNPNQPGCEFPDKNIAGAHTLWLVLAATRQELIRRRYLPSDSPTLTDLVDYVALSTVADCVSIASKNNRAVVRAGLKRINVGARPAWRAIRPYLVKKGNRPITAEELAWGLAPRINASGRIRDPLNALKLLLSRDDSEAAGFAEQLEQQNLERRELEARLKESALAEAAELVAEGRLGLAIFMADGHIGLSGLVASRVVAAYGRPTIVFAVRPGTDDLVGSARSIDALHIQQCLQDIHEKYPGLLLKHGGHRAAAGLTIEVNNANLFLRAFDMAVRKRLKPEDVGPVIWTDGTLEPSQIHIDTIAGFSDLEPFGREFDSPRFHGQFLVCESRAVGSDKTHLQMLLRTSHEETRFIKAIWFRAMQKEGNPLPVEADDGLRAVYELMIDDYNGKQQPTLRILYGEKTAAPIKARPKRYI